MELSAYRHRDEMTGSHAAAERIVPLILALTGPVRSVVDVGGGDGAWLRAFRDQGAKELLLVDDPGAKTDLVIDAACFHPIDLARALPEPRRADVALCLECAEHLPSHRATPLVEWLADTADVVVFSAAVPGQGGKGHINEQPPEYWSELFARRGFSRHDVVRPSIVHDEAIPWWYRQNVFVFATANVTLRAPALDFLPGDFRLLHRSVADALQSPPLRMVLRAAGPALLASIRRRIGGA